MRNARAEVGLKTLIDVKGANVDIGVVELIVGGAAVIFGPSGTMAVVIKTRLNGHLDKITETNTNVKDIQSHLYGIDKRVTILETKEEVAR